jgi:hypothetical protein
MQIVIIIEKEEKKIIFSLFYLNFSWDFSCHRRRRFSSCSHTIRKTFSSYFELPPYFVLYDCLGKFKLFKKKFLCATKGEFFLVMTCLLLQEKKGIKKKMS